MKRLTKKELQGDYIFINGENSCPNELATKLGELEDIEERLGIELITLFKALENGFYVKRKDGSIHYMSSKQLDEIDELITTVKAFIGALKALKKQGITWALTKEELEK